MTKLVITPFITEDIKILDSYIIDWCFNILVHVKICFSLLEVWYYKCKCFFVFEIIVQVIKLIGFNTKTWRWGKANFYLTGSHNKLRRFDLYISSNQWKTKKNQQPEKKNHLFFVWLQIQNCIENTIKMIWNSS